MRCGLVKPKENPLSLCKRGRVEKWQRKCECNKLASFSFVGRFIRQSEVSSTPFPRYDPHRYEHPIHRQPALAARATVSLVFAVRKSLDRHNLRERRSRSPVPKRACPPIPFVPLTAARYPWPVRSRAIRLRLGYPGLERNMRFTNAFAHASLHVTWRLSTQGSNISRSPTKRPFVAATKPKPVEGVGPSKLFSRAWRPFRNHWLTTSSDLLGHMKNFQGDR